MESEIYPKKIILIVSTERSGSTTLQRILNTIPHSNITGENYNVIVDLLRVYQNLKNIQNNKYNYYKTIDEFILKSGKPAWYNSFDICNVKENIKKTITSILDNGKQNRVIGFKEIRYFNCIELVNEFIELFPNTFVICHYRKNLIKQKKSIVIAKHKTPLNNIDKFLKLYTNQILDFYKHNKNNCYLSCFEDLFNIENIMNIFKFLDEPFDENEYKNIISNSLENKKK